MFRTYSLIFIITIALFFHGCSTLEYLDGSSKEDVEQFKMSKSEMYNELKKVQVENEKLREQTQSTQAMNRQLVAENEKKLAYVSEQNRILHQEVEGLKQNYQRLSEENESLKSKLADTQTKAETASAASPKANKGGRSLSIKVLYGDGDPRSAQKMAARLKKMGHNISVIDQAPRSNFEMTTIYFAPKSKYEAKRLISDLGGKLILKPLSWPSKFDLIIVTGASN